MASKNFLLYGLLVLVAVTSHTAARELADTSDAHDEVKDIAGYPKGGGYHGGGGYPGGGGHHGGAYDEVKDAAGNLGGGGYPGGGGGGGGYPGGGSYCRYGCCGHRDYHGGCLRCCGLASETVDTKVEVKPHN
ncbi:hypothetical protein vseg_018095 [Gypsophila vaccaria]